MKLGMVACTCTSSTRESEAKKNQKFKENNTMSQKLTRFKYKVVPSQPINETLEVHLQITVSRLPYYFHLLTLPSRLCGGYSDNSAR